MPYLLKHLVEKCDAIVNAEDDSLPNDPEVIAIEKLTRIEVLLRILLGRTYNNGEEVAIRVRNKDEKEKIISPAVGE